MINNKIFKNEFFSMLLEVFEVRGLASEEIDKLIIKLHKKFPDTSIRKINVLDEEKMKTEAEIKELIRINGLEILPIFRLEGKIVSKDFLERLNIRKL